MRSLEELRRRRIYRARNGMIMGVCKGLARYLDVPVFAVRILAVIVVIASHLVPAIIAYIVAGFVLKPEPVIPPKDEREQEVYDGYVHSKTRTVEKIKDKYDRLDKRIRRVEDFVTSKEYDFDRRLKNS
ncbi:envelope stress response membrane protein PspC [Desulfovibrio inopinatus]|uniref:envelope stress response membrane protein PspC n=1 Tax=Desulfovibrio inopinatus TaxID=102109 RepID=UPI0003F84C8C|nr:envelope stress response membrane protein PspC [Desulfovibrio inopinatus]